MRPSWISSPLSRSALLLPPPLLHQARAVTARLSAPGALPSPSRRPRSASAQLRSSLPTRFALPDVIGWYLLSSSRTTSPARISSIQVSVGSTKTSVRSPLPCDTAALQRQAT